MDENNLSSLGLNFPPILVIKVMQVIAYMLTCIYCVTIINCTSSAVCSNPFDIIDVCHWNSLLDTKLSDLKTDRLRCARSNVEDSQYMLE
jgi:rRNA maturation endonuclease Nob1